MKPDKRAILVHGFNVKDDGKGTTGQLTEPLLEQGYRVIEFTPGWRGLLGVRFGNKRRAQNLAKIIRSGDLLIGHSDGCNLIDKACHELSSLGDESVKCVYFNPALDRDTALSRIVSKCLVFHTRSDKTVWLSRWLAFHPWGEMGRKGYKPESPNLMDTRYRNVSLDKLGYPDLKHSGVFKHEGSLNACLAQIQIAFGNVPKAIPVDDA